MINSFRDKENPHRATIIFSFFIVSIMLIAVAFILAFATDKGFFPFWGEFGKPSLTFFTGIYFLLLSFLIRFFARKKACEKVWGGRINLWRQLSPKELRRFALAVFCIFATLGPIGIFQTEINKPITIFHVLFMTFFSGGIAAVVIIFANRKFLLIPFLCFFVLGSYFHNEIESYITGQEIQSKPQVTKAITLTPAELERIENERENLGSFVIALIVSGYILFIFVIGKEGQKRIRLQTEVDVARKIQDSINYSKNGIVNGIYVESLTVPAAEIGGDYVDCFPVNSNELLLVIADASGHGVGSGLYAAMAKSTIKCLLQMNVDVKGILENLNKTLFQIAAKDKFLTAALVKVDTLSKTVEIATAGHHPVLFKTGSAVREIRTPSVGLGISQKSVYSTSILKYEPGDKLLLFTDGLIEAGSKVGEEYGLSRVIDIFINSESNEDNFTGAILDRVRGFSGNKEIRDDISLVYARL